MERVFRLSPGQSGPVQQSSVSCGAACLAVARMIRDPATARWVVDGPARDTRTPDERFAELERRILRRTNSVAPWPDRRQLPWPQALGTSPWGALAELENGVAEPGTAYRLLTVRGLSPDRLGRVFDDVIAATRPGEPALLYVGTPTLPRHVCLLFADERERTLLLYEPSSGAVDWPSREAFVGSRLGLGGWDRPWFLIAAARRAARAPAYRAGFVPVRGAVSGAVSGRVTGPAMLRGEAGSALPPAVDRPPVVDRPQAGRAPVDEPRLRRSAQPQPAG